jgi:hypothetical protein
LSNIRKCLQILVKHCKNLQIIANSSAEPFYGNIRHEIALA